MLALIILFCLFIILASIAGAELTCRRAGFAPFNPVARIKYFEPGICLEPDENTGYRLKPGMYTAHYFNGCSFKMEHDFEGNRLTGSAEEPATGGALTGLNIYGDSFLYGFGVNDEDTMCWKLHQLCPGIRLRNRTVMGFGAVNYLQRIKSDFNVGPVPDLAFIQFSSYDLPKQVFSGETDRNLSFNSVLKPFSFPYVKSASPALTIALRKLSGKSYWLSRISALHNKFESRQMAEELKAIDTMHVCCVIYDAIISECQNHGVKAVILVLTSDKVSADMMAYFAQKNVDCIDLALDFKNPLYNSLPNDNHPSPLAHSIFASRIQKYFAAKGIAIN